MKQNFDRDTSHEVTCGMFHLCHVDAQKFQLAVKQPQTDPSGVIPGGGIVIVGDDGAMRVNAPKTFQWDKT